MRSEQNPPFVSAALPDRGAVRLLTWVNAVIARGTPPLRSVFAPAISFPEERGTGFEPATSSLEG